MRELMPQLFSGHIDATDLRLLLKSLEGWHYRGAYLSQSGFLLGMAVFQDGTATVTDPSRRTTQSLDIRRHTILVDKGLYHKDQEHVFRFTFAHECGHALLHERFCQDPENMKAYAEQGKEKILKDSAQDFAPKEKERLKTDRDWLEWQANAFASCVLMPRTLVLQTSRIIRQQCDTELEYLNELKATIGDVFKVSSSASFYRMKSLKLLPADARLVQGGMIVTDVRS